MTSSNNNVYEMRKKLLDLQNELLKNAGSEPEPAFQSVPEPHYTASQRKEAENANQHDSASILKELVSTQKKILDILVEINGKLK